LVARAYNEIGECIAVREEEFLLYLANPDREPGVDFCEKGIVGMTG
jgi:hypothetical protein